MAKRYPKLRGRIVEIFGNQRAFAKEIGVSLTCVNETLMGKTGFDDKKITKWATALNIPRTDYGLYFFDIEFESST